MRPRHRHLPRFAIALVVAIGPGGLACGIGGSRASAKDGEERLVPHLEVRLRWSDGRITASAMSRGEHRERSGEAALAHRFEARGRYVARVEIAGRTRGDPVRFDFPLLADADAGNAEAVNETMKKHVTSETTIRLPLPPAQARAMIVISDDKAGHELRAVVPTPLAETGLVEPPPISLGHAPPPPRTERPAPAPAPTPIRGAAPPLWHPAGQPKDPLAPTPSPARP